MFYMVNTYLLLVEYLCYGSAIIINIFTFTVRGMTLDVRI